MVKSAKERMQEYRQRLRDDPEKLEIVRAKDRERWKNRNEHKIADLSDKKKKQQKKKWKKASKEYRERQKRLKEIVEITPPSTPAQVSADDENDVEAMPQEVIVNPAEPEVDQNKVQILTKVLSCYCTWPTLCSCYKDKDILLANIAVDNSISTTDTRNTSTPSEEPETVTLEGIEPEENPKSFSKDDDLVSRWCIVDYDGKPYVGKVLTQDEDSVEIHELRKVGQNKFVEPSDALTIWYTYDKVISMIPDPEHTSKRQLTLQIATWDKFFTCN